MCFPREWYQIQHTLESHMPHLRPSQQRGLSLWVYGTVLAHSACQNAVITALLAVGNWHSLRQQLREWLYDGTDKAAPCQSQLEVSECFAPLLAWILHWWQGNSIAFALDATAHGDRVVALVISVLYRGSAIPVAWHILPANQPGAWMPHIVRLFHQLHPALPKAMQVLVLVDRGLWSPRLWKVIRARRWHPVMRIQASSSFQPLGQRRRSVKTLVAGPGYAWVGEGVAFKDRAKRRAGTLVVVWDVHQQEPWVVLSDLPPSEIGVCWYGLRMWVELGFRALKGVGWQWQHTRRTDPKRVARHWLVLAVTTLWVMAYGTRAEDAEQQGVAPANLRTPPKTVSSKGWQTTGSRRVSVFRLGLSWLHASIRRGRLWRRLWLRPEPWPEPSKDLVVLYHMSPSMTHLFPGQRSGG